MNPTARLAGIVILVLFALPGTGFTQTPSPAPKPVPAITGFHIAVLLADNKPGEAVEGLPASVNKALTDARQFLRFKNYRMLDTAWLRGMGYLRARVVGLAGREYSASIVSGQKGALLDVEFKLRDYPGAEGAIPVMETGFQMTVGETVVVGTSRVTGTEQALVFLLTAIPGGETGPGR